MDRTPWILLDTQTTGIKAPIYVVELAAQRMRGWEPDDAPFQRMLNHDVDIQHYRGLGLCHRHKSRPDRNLLTPIFLNLPLSEIVWHRQETRRQIEKTNFALQLGEFPAYSKPQSSHWSS